MELALCLPLVVIILAALIEMGLLSLDRVRVWHAAREGARVAAVDPDIGAIRAAAEDAGVEPLEIKVYPGAAYRRQGEGVMVEVTYHRDPVVPLVGDLFGRVDLHAEAAMRVEQP